MADITMPQLGETVVEGTIIKWFKKVGDTVARDETLFEVSTDKVDSEVPSVAAGYLSEILVSEGETVDVGTRLAVVTEGEPAADGAGKAAPETAPDADGKDDAPVPVEAGAVADDDGDRPSPPAEKTSQNAEAKTDPTEAPPADRPAAQPRTGGAALLSPVVRRLIAENDLDVDQIPGTGQSGRVTRADVLSFIDQGRGSGRQSTSGSASSGAKSRPQAAAPSPARAGEDHTEIPFSNIRRRTAEHMVRSQATSAHVLTVVEVDFAAVDRVRLAEREEFKAKEGFSLTYLPFVARAVVDAMADYPNVNASVGDDTLIVHRRINLGFAVDLDHEGLIVPVVRDADAKRLTAIARGLADLASRARSRELTADDISGGTFTITNPGPFGTFLTAPVINQPQVAILSTDGVRKKPVAVELPDGTDAVAIHPVGNLALSFDHRAFDGAYAGAFLGRCRQILETRDWSQEV
ncbi:MAG: 2-oxo acid dehydrogenase subunit E2 [Acidimicrobiia bacterium]|nr:2-oxo acid dehydrogenase subunit E2 [Acidimicrobiia bacterium]